MLMLSNSDDESSRCLQFFREANHVLPKNLSGETSQTDNQRRNRPLRVLSDISGFSTVFMPGASSSFIFKTAKSSPHILRLRGGYTRWLSSFDSANTGCEKGFIYVDSQVRPLLHSDGQSHLYIAKPVYRAASGLVNCPHKPNLTIRGPCARLPWRSRLITWLTLRLLKHTYLLQVNAQTSGCQRVMTCTPNGAVKVCLCVLLIFFYWLFANAAFRHIFLSGNPSEQHKGH